MGATQLVVFSWPCMSDSRKKSRNGCTKSTLPSGDTGEDAMLTTEDSMGVQGFFEEQALGAIPTEGGLIISIPLELMRHFVTEGLEARSRTSRN